MKIPRTFRIQNEHRGHVGRALEWSELSDEIFPDRGNKTDTAM